MHKLFIILSLLPFCLFSQSSKILSKAELTKTYTQAITDFIKAANKKNKSHFDTLFFGIRKDGDPNSDFPDITLPETIEKTQIKLISPAMGAIKQKERPSRIYINLMGLANKENAEFIFVVFSNGFHHQYDCHINYKYSKQTKVFELEKLQFKEPPFDK